MFLDYTEEQAALRTELRAYFERLLTPEVRAAMGHAGEGSASFRTVVGQMGADGWLGIGWPAEYGGQGRGVIDQFIFFDEVQRAGAPFPFVTLNTVGPTLMAYGSDEHKRTYLPGILRGEINFAIGYTEPEAGTDLASLRTRAVLDGDEWVINGNKVFTSGANQADYVWLACRTDPDAPKHKGISIIIVPTAHPASRRRRSSPSAASSRRRRTTTRCGCRAATSSARSTAAGGSSRTSSTTSASASPRWPGSRSASTTTWWSGAASRRRAATAGVDVVATPGWAAVPAKSCSTCRGCAAIWRVPTPSSRR